MGAGNQDSNRLHVALAGWQGDGAMTRQVDTYNHTVGAMALDYPWWQVIRISPNSFIESDEAYDDWYVTLYEYDPDTGETVVGPLNLNHKVVMRTARQVVDDPQYSDYFRSECRNLIRDADDADFDQPLADALIQVALLGEVKYG